MSWAKRHGTTLLTACVALLVGIGAGVGVVKLLAHTSTNPGIVGEPILVKGTPEPLSIPPWLVVNGKWRTADGQAFVSPSASGAELAVLESTPRVEAAQIRLDSVGNGAGLVFAFKSPDDYWAVTAVPDYATWSVVQVAHGVATGEGNLGLDSLAGGSVLQVVLHAHTAELGLDGKVLRVITEPSITPGRVGMTVAGSGATQTVFGDFQVVPVPSPLASRTSSPSSTTRRSS